MIPNFLAQDSSVTSEEAKFFELHPGLDPASVEFTDGQIDLPDFEVLEVPRFKHLSQIGATARKAALQQKRLDVSISAARVKWLLSTAAANGMSQHDFELVAATTTPGTGRVLLPDGSWLTVGYNGKLWHHYMKTDAKMKATTFNYYITCFFERGWINDVDQKEAHDFSAMTSGTVSLLKLEKPEVRAVLKTYPELELASELIHVLTLTQKNSDAPVGTNLSH